MISVQNFLNYAKKCTITVTLAVSMTSTLAVSLLDFSLQRRGRNVSDIGVPMYEGGDSALITWIIGFPLLCVVLKYGLDLVINSNSRLTSWIIGVLGLGFWLLYALALLY